MKHLSRYAVAIAALLVPSGAVSADANAAFGPEPVSAFAVPLVSADPAPSVLVRVPGAELAPRAHGGAYISTSAPRLHAARYRPRRRSSRAPRASYGGTTQIHLGFFEPENASKGILFGVRGGPKVDEHIQVGLGLDWRYESEHQSEVVGTGTAPGGQEVVIRRDIARSTSHHIPLQGFIELNAGNDMTVVPYFGLGGGYQWLVLEGEDFSTGEFFEATFGNWGWQAWGGVAIPLSWRSRLNAEVFVNGATLNRDTRDASSGELIRETIDMDGIGARFGLSFGLF